MMGTRVCRNRLRGNYSTLAGDDILCGSNDIRDNEQFKIHVVHGTRKTLETNRFETLR